jgi:hypothetical protein
LSALDRLGVCWLIALQKVENLGIKNQNPFRYYKTSPKVIRLTIAV